MFDIIINVLDYLLGDAIANAIIGWMDRVERRKFERDQRPAYGVVTADHQPRTGLISALIGLIASAIDDRRSQ